MEWDRKRIHEGASNGKEISTPPGIKNRSIAGGNRHLRCRRWCTYVVSSTTHLELEEEFPCLAYPGSPLLYCLAKVSRTQNGIYL